MSEKSQNTGKIAPKLVLYSALDWGLGHTTRSIPIIRILLQQNFDVVIACNSIQKSIFAVEFPTIVFVEMEGYSITYGKKGWFTPFQIIFQIPKILTKIKNEKRWVDQFILSKKPTFILSDNRYGFFSNKVTSIIITHQLRIKTGWGPWADRQLQKWHYRLLRSFSACWVPDFENKKNNLAGELSHPEHLAPIPVTYIGGLSRLQPCTNDIKKGFLLVLLSGPEPQRSLLEKIILKDALQVKQSIILVRGLPENAPSINGPSNVTVFNYLDSKNLNTYLCDAMAIICRSGYTSVMDFAKINGRALLIPTPGQPEQEYLAAYLEAIQFAPYLKQKDFTVKKAIDRIACFSYFKFEGDMEQFKKTIPETLAQLPVKT